ncbi:hypothetical protein IIC65_00340, partial [Candidatus Sumerlaeota bacterium]|nr:hypothetical protein [Candidatus Sumerlaeota bacterium]
MLSLGMLAPSAASGAPEFVLDGRVGALEQLILAVDAEGPVTALDVLFYLDMAGYRAGALEVGHWLAEEGDRDPGAWQRIREGVEEYLAVRALARRSSIGTGADATSLSAPSSAARQMLHTGAEAAWIETTVRPAITVTQTDVNRHYITHPELYARPRRVQVRTIFTRVADMSQIALQREALQQLGALRDRIVAGELAFEDAARQFSEASSGAGGGLLP